MQEWTARLAAWWKQGTNRLLVLAGFGAVSVSALSDIPEVVPFGRELGLGVSALSFSYVGAYIFNYLINERPKRDAYRKAYAAAWRDLSQVANNANGLLEDLHFLADRKESGPHAREYVDGLCNAIEFGPMLHPPQLDVGDIIQRRIEWHSEYYQKLSPLIALFEADVVSALASVNSNDFFLLMRDLPRERPVRAVNAKNDGKTQFGGYSAVVHEYVVQSDVLRQTLAASSYAPGPVEWSLDVTAIHRMNWESMHGR